MESKSNEKLRNAIPGISTAAPMQTRSIRRTIIKRKIGVLRLSKMEIPSKSASRTAKILLEKLF